MASTDAILAGMATSLILTSLGAWIAAVRRIRSGRSLVTFEPRRLVPWGFLDLAIAICLGFLLQVFARWALAGVDAIPETDIPKTDSLPDLGPEQQTWLVLTVAGASMAGAILSLLALLIRTPSTLRDAGWVSVRTGRDIWLGVSAFVMLAPIAYGIQILLVRWFASKHPLIEMLQASPRWTLLASAGFSAVLVAPVVEEYLYRVLLQGWLEKLAALPDDTGRLLLGDSPQPPSLPADADPSSQRETPNVTKHPDWWPLFVSALIFALLHWGNGPDWVALFVFALGLGYLYQQTHRVLPSIVAHLLLNAWSLTTLLIQISGRPIMH